jgi:alanyl-tRNA synthetase
MFNSFDTRALARGEDERSSSTIREKYLNFFKLKNHSIIQGVSLIPENDPSTLFIGSGMQPLLPYLLGEKHPNGKRLVNFQRSFRAADIEEVGDGRHTTFFEMLGNWSLGDYFKEEQLNWIYQFLVEELKIDPKRLYATVYEGNQEIGIDKDLESVEILKRIFKKYGIDAVKEKKIFYYGDKKNWWSRVGAPENMPIGEPGGPDSEIFYDLGIELKKHENSEFKNQRCHLNCDCGRFIEIGNSVFMEYIKTKNGFEKLPQKNVDFGGGLERITMAVQNKDNVFETDLFHFLIKALEEKSNKNYKDYKKSFEIISDHLRAIIFLIADGVLPSNKDQGYFVRRLIRRLVIHLKKIEINPFEVSYFISLIIRQMSSVYPHLSLEEKNIQKNIKQEVEKFSLTIDRGLKIFKEINFSNKKISGETVFTLFTTYGFPVELIQELTVEQKGGYGVEIEEFRKKMEEHQVISRKGLVQKFRGGLADDSEETTKLHTATHLLLQALRRVLGNHIFQKGSNITAERLRFDFSHPDKISDEDIKKVEEIVNNVIKQELPISFKEISLSEAEKMRAIGVFQSKYDKEKVKVYQIGEGENVFSLEICGGPHINNTKELGTFKIIKQESVSAGIRRIRAILE